MKSTDKRGKKAKTEHRPETATKRTKRITAALTRSIALILVLSVMLPVIGYYFLPDWVYYLTAATQLWFSGNNITAEYNKQDFLQTLKDVEINSNANIEIYDEDDNLIYSTVAVNRGEEIDIKGGKPLSKEYCLSYEIKEGKITNDSWGYLIREYKSDTMSVTFLELFTHFDDGDRLHICTQVSQSTMVSKVEILVMFMALMIFLIIAVFIIMNYVRSFAKPINKMVAITGNMSRLDFSEKCPQVKYEEFAQLSDSINVMSASLDSALTELKDKNSKLQQDIENERTIDELRQTFISGISHELKTPIAIIQGYAEGAKAFYGAGNTALADQYCDTIAEEATRMNNMIMRLLEITRYDSGAIEPNRENFNIHDEVQDWFDRNSTIIEEKGVKVVNEIPAALVVNGDRFLIASIINNYLSNAMSHVEGDKIITAFVRKENGRTRVFIANTGKQIADKDIDKIWTSFYRADKSLSRKQGRFGLGLAIVASIQRLHGEQYGVNNTGTGVEFWFDTRSADFIDQISD